MSLPPAELWIRFPLKYSCCLVLLQHLFFMATQAPVKESGKTLISQSISLSIRPLTGEGGRGCTMWLALGWCCCCPPGGDLRHGCRSDRPGLGRLFTVHHWWNALWDSYPTSPRPHRYLEQRGASFALWGTAKMHAGKWVFCRCLTRLNSQRDEGIRENKFCLSASLIKKYRNDVQ